MSLVEVIDDFATGTYTTSRPGAQTVTNGIVSHASSTVTTGVTMCIQPLSGRELKVLPEAYHKEEVRLVFTTFALKVLDTITIDGETWTVFKVEAWQDFDSETHTRAYAARSTPA